MECSWSAVMSTYDTSKITNQRQGVKQPGRIDARGKLRVSRVVRSIGKSTVEQITETFNRVMCKPYSLSNVVNTGSASTRVDGCPPWEMSTELTRALQLDRGSMEEVRLIR